ncbi:unnamed protein product [Notodromas monacha]|uniref:Uncharacterized protein n=1 Tax=Notodromas monacha TaxID=399045 RepID=A0A7R9GD24_9CRUS|nr:unnamed protein product [Notodromas monacha]CAG0916711.1 unnamed protein product [Notodromas monacha]
MNLSLVHDAIDASVFENRFCSDTVRNPYAYEPHVSYYPQTVAAHSYYEDHYVRYFRVTGFCMESIFGFIWISDFWEMSLTKRKRGSGWKS